MSAGCRGRREGVLEGGAQGADAGRNLGGSAVAKVKVQGTSDTTLQQEGHVAGGEVDACVCKLGYWPGLHAAGALMHLWVGPGHSEVVKYNEGWRQLRWDVWRCPQGGACKPPQLAHGGFDALPRQVGRGHGGGLQMVMSSTYVMC